MTAKESMRARYETRHESITAYKFMRADQENISIFSNIKRIFMPYNKYVLYPVYMPYNKHVPYPVFMSYNKSQLYNKNTDFILPNFYKNTLEWAD